MDWTVYDESRIARLPRPFQAAALFARNVRDFFGPPPPHQGDGITTIHNTGFMHTPDFERAYARAVKAGGWDYEIPYRVQQALWCARNAPEGNFVELGTGRGFIMSAVLALCPTRSVHLFDTFRPPSTETGNLSPYYATSPKDVIANFAEWPNVTIHQGDVFETLPKADTGPIAFLHVDMNAAAPEVFGVRHLWSNLADGALMLFDDYAYAGFEAQYEAMNQLADELGFRILSTATGQGIAIKQA